jgi:ABC-2 type transport system ATP-binding protein
VSTNSPDIAVSVDEVTHSYGGSSFALRNVSFRIGEGEFFALLGPNGGGKTTLFRILSTLLSPSYGRASVFGSDTSGDPASVRRRLGVVFQQAALDDELTARENLSYQGALYGLKGADLRDRINYLLDLFGLRARANERIKTFSGGMQRKIDLARGLLHRPDLLLLDEPTTGLDPVARREFWQALGRLRRSEGTTVLLATHLLEEADVADTVGIIDRGSLVALGAPGDLTAELGGETLWMETSDPRGLNDLLQARFGVEGRVVADGLQVSHREPHTLLSKVYEDLSDRIDSATIRRPTLEDVFIVHTGHRIDETEVVETAAALNEPRL